MGVYDGLYGNYDYGVEYYSAQIVDANVGPAVVATGSTSFAGRAIRRGSTAITAASTWSFAAATRLRTSTLAILAAAVCVFTGRRLWEPDIPSSGTWFQTSPFPDPWTPLTPGGDPWTKQ